MNVTRWRNTDGGMKTQIGALLEAVFPHSYAGPEACAEADRLCAEDRILMLACEDGRLIGLCGAIPQYGVTGWELHPLAVADGFRNRGIGTMLVRALEREVAAQGGITIYLGTDDENCGTSLAGTDLYKNLHEKMQGIRNVNHHPFAFYRKLGYTLVGVLPDANGFGKPDLYMARRIVPWPEKAE